MSESTQQHPRKKPRRPFPPVPPAAAEVQLIDDKTAAAIGGMGTTWWHAKVAASEAPAPVVRSPRCTRWRLTEVVSFWKIWAAAAGRGSTSA